jgi:hypothetical protein
MSSTGTGSLCSQAELKFIYISSIRASKKNVEEIATFGRKRWKIENEGFAVI